MTFSFKISASWICFFCIFWLLLLDVKLPLLNTGGSILVAIAMLIIFKPYFFIKMKLDHYVTPFFILLMLYSVYVVFRSLWGQDIAYFLAMLKILLIMFFAYAMTMQVLYSYGERFYITIILSIFFVVSISPALYYFFGWYRGFVEIFQINLDLSVPISERGALGVRRSFPTGSGGFFGMAILLGFYSYILVFLYIKKTIGFKLFLCLFSVAIVSAIIAGRVAILFFLASCLVFFMTRSLKGKINTILVLFIFITMQVVFFELLQGREVILSLASEYPLASWILEPLVNFLKYGVVESRSTNHLMEMWYMPSEMTILLGDGLYADYYGGTDIGYMRQILFGGFPVILFSLVFSILMVRVLPLIYGLFFLLLLLLVHAKGNVILGAPMTMGLLSTFYAYVCFSSERSRDNE